MRLFNLPKWLIPHLFSGKKFVDLTHNEILKLKEALSRFSEPDPEISIVIPAWNEANNIFKTLSSLAATSSKSKIEIIVINNNSTDGTQLILEKLAVKTFFEKEQGTAHARQLGLLKARGKFHLCADSDTFYPPGWIDLMTKPMRANKKSVGVYGRYSFVPSTNIDAFILPLYEALTGLIIRIRKKRREHINFLGFNMGFVTAIGKDNGGFIVTDTRKFDNAKGSDYFVEEAEDGRMALNLKKSGVLKLVTDPQARVFTSSRRLIAEGGILTALKSRLALHTIRLKEYFAGPSAESF